MVWSVCTCSSPTTLTPSLSTSGAWVGDVGDGLIAQPRQVLFFRLTSGPFLSCGEVVVLECGSGVERIAAAFPDRGAGQEVGDGVEQAAHGGDEGAFQVVSGAGLLGLELSGQGVELVEHAQCVAIGGVEQVS